MKKICITFLSLFLLLSCKDSQQEKDAVLTESNGKINNVSIIIDENLWNGEVGDSIRKKFAAPVDGLLTEEPLFNLNQYPTKIFEGFVRNSRNIIFLKNLRNHQDIVQSKMNLQNHNKYFILLVKPMKRFLPF